MGSVSVIPLTVSLLAALIAATTDLSRLKIFNWLTIPLIVGGLIYQGIVTEGTFPILGGLGMALGFLALFPFHWAGGMGAGDVKLFAGLGAWMGPVAICELLLATSILTGVYAAFLLQRRFASQKLRHMDREDARSRASMKKEKEMIPFGVVTAASLFLLVIHSQWI